MVNWKLLYTRKAQKDSKKISNSDLKEKVMRLLAILQIDPLKIPPPCKKLVGDLFGAYSRRINIQHRLVYEILEDKKIVKIISMWSHYE